MFSGARRHSWREKGGNWTQQALRPLGFQNYGESWGFAGFRRIGARARVDKRAEKVALGSARFTPSIHPHTDAPRVLMLLEKLEKGNTNLTIV